MATPQVIRPRPVFEGALFCARLERVSTDQMPKRWCQEALDEGRREDLAAGRKQCLSHERALLRRGRSLLNGRH